MKPTKIVPHLAASLIAASSAHAATISWTVSNITGNESDISTVGTIVSTAGGTRIGGTGVTGASVTVNGVEFFDNQTFDSVTHFDDITSRTGIPSSGPSANYHTLLRFVDRNSNSADQSITLTGLTIGTPYQFQVWASDTLAGTAGQSGIVLNDGTGSSPNPATSGHATILYEVTETGPGQYAIGTFTADAATQQIVVRRWTNLTTTPAATNQQFVNAWQLRAIPEPSVALLAGLGLLGLARRRR